MQTYLFLAKAKLLHQLTYRFEAFAGFVLSLIPLGAMVYVWKDAFKENGGLVGGVNKEQMICYTIMAVALKDVFFFRTQDTLLSGVQSGSIAIDLLRPYSLLGRYLTEDIATSLITIIRRFVPLLLFSWLFISSPLPHSVTAGTLSVLSVMISYCILWQLSALVGLIAFWFMEAGNLGMVKDTIVRIFSGSIVPIWFFPEPVQRISGFLPFQYTYQTPLSIYIGKSTGTQAYKEMGLQSLWAISLSAVLWVAWKKAQKKLMIQGG